MSPSEGAADRPMLGIDDILKLLVDRVIVLLDAERCTVFLHDAERGELVSRVLTGKRSEIRVPSSAGLAGASFTSGEVINVADAYADPRFNREVDLRTGFRTRCVLCCPIVRSDGTKIGVIQAINKRGGVFSGHDLELLRVFSDQTAIILQNALAEELLSQARLKQQSLAAELAENHAKLQSAFRDLNSRQEELQSALARIKFVRRLSWGIAGVVVTIGLLVMLKGTSLRRGAAAPAVTREAVVETKDIRSVLSLAGVLEPIAIEPVPSPFSGRIRAVRASFGDQVAAGDVLLEIDTTQLEVELRDLESRHIEVRNRYEELLNWEKGREMAAAKRSVERLRYELETGRTQAETSRKLNRRGVVSDLDLRAAEDQVRNLEVQLMVSEEDLAAIRARGDANSLRIARNALENLELDLKRKRDNRARSLVAAPIAGVVLRPPSDGRDRPLAPGREISEAEVAMLIGNLEGFRVRGSVDEADVLKLRVGQPVAVTGEAFHGIALSGRMGAVSMQGKSLDGLVSKFDIEVRIPVLSPEARARVLLGMTADLAVEIYAKTGATVIPSSALLGIPGRYGVQVPGPDGKPVLRPVEIGVTTEGGVEILSGLKPGDRVLLL